MEVAVKTDAREGSVAAARVVARRVRAVAPLAGIGLKRNFNRVRTLFLCV